MTIRKAKGLTLKEVAQSIGVSTATVSNAFNRPSQLSQDLRDDILRSCKKMGYRGPKAESRQRHTSKTKVVGVMVPNKLSYSFADIPTNLVLQGIAKVFDPLEYSILVIPPWRNLKGFNGLESFVDGFIAYGPPSPEQLSPMRYHRKSIVSIDCHLAKSVSINIDNHQSAFECASLAFAHKPKRIAIIGPRMARGTETTNLKGASLHETSSNIMLQRLLGYKDAALSSGARLSDEHIWSIPENSHFYAYETTRYILQQSSRPELILCMSDQIAISAIQAATELGLSVPKDIHITGFDGLSNTSPSELSLTTVEQPHFEKGKVAAEVFLGFRSEQDVRLKSPLIIGQSCPQVSHN